MANFDSFDFSSPTGGGFGRPAPEKPSLTGELFMAIPRGIEGALQDTYGLLDTLAFDALPDYDERLLGENQTGVGRVAEGIANFAAGFIPVAGWLGKGGRVARALGTTVDAEKALRTAGNVRGALAVAARRGAAAGAVADFTVFDGHEERLADLIQSFPALANPVTEFLAADSDDPQLVGRFKAVVEGLGLGMVAEGLALSLRALKAGRKARAGGASAEAAEAAMDAVVPPDAIDAALGAPVRDVAEEVGGEIPAGEFMPGTGPAQGVSRDGSMAGVLKALGADPKRTEEIQAALKNREEIAEQFSPGSGIPGQNASGVNPRALTKAERLELELTRSDLNLSRYRGTEGAMHLIRAYEDLFDEAWRGENKNLMVQSFEQQAEASARELADLVQANDPRSLMVVVQRRIAKDSRELPRINARVRAYKTLLLNYIEEIDRTMPKVGEAVSDAHRVKFAQDVETLADIMSGVKGLLAEQGRGLGANRIETRSIEGFLDLATNTTLQADAVRGLGGAEHVDELMAKFRAAKATTGAAGATKLAQATRFGKFVNWTSTYWMNAILSGPPTWVVNSMSGAFMSVYRPLEALAGAAVNRGVAKVRGDRATALLSSEVMQDAIREITELIHAVPEAMRAAKAVFKTGDNILAPHRRVLDTAQRRNVISAANAPLDLSKSPAMAHAVNWIGRQVDIPSRILAAQDEFTKQITYRASARAQLTREALTLGVPAQNVGEYVARKMEELISKGQAYSSATVYNKGLEVAKTRGINNPDIAREFAQEYAAKNFDRSLNPLSEKALAYADEVTFTKALPPNSMSAKLQQMVIQHPTMRFIVPFVRTPLNILGYAAQRYDVPHAVQALAGKVFPKYATALRNSQNRMVMDLMSKNARRQAEAMGRLTAGFGFASFAISLAGEGVITGRGPKDPEQRRILEAAGWQPYSIKTPAGYVSYQRLDPLATIIGTIADTFDYCRLASDDEQEQVEQLAFGISVALANNFTNKTYLTGISNFVEAIQSPDRKMESFFQRYAASFVPNAVGQLNRVGNDHEREIRTMLDAMVNKVPGLSESLPPIRNLFGEPVRRSQAAGADSIGSVMNMLLPVAYREVSDSEVSQELAALGHGFTPPRTKVNGVDLLEFRNGRGQDAYDRWMELNGSVRVNGLTLAKALRKTIKSSEYQKLSDASTIELESPRVAVIQNIIKDYRRASYRQLLKEYPDVRVAERAFVRRKQQLRQGNDLRFLTEN